jgi:hypothetical protein
MYGENEETKSISTWYTMAISGAAATNPTTGVTTTVTATAGGVSFETAALASFGMLIVGFVVGLMVITKFALPRKSRSRTG